VAPSAAGLHPDDVEALRCLVAAQVAAMQQTLRLIERQQACLDSVARAIAAIDHAAARRGIHAAAPLPASASPR
jgi:hypothetical protein